MSEPQIAYNPMTASATTIRRAAAADAPALLRMLGRAFLEDPVARWVCRSSALRPAVLEAMHRARLRQMLTHETIWTTEDASSAALWAPPGNWQTGILQDAALARGLIRPQLMARLPLLVLGLSGIHRRHPDTPRHWYLSLLGTDPDVQGRGFGSAVLRPVLERCDADRVGAYLESSDERNLDFYARHGFRVTAELRLPRGPMMWSMWREPSATSWD